MNTMVEVEIEKALSEFSEPDAILTKLAEDYLPLTLEEDGIDRITEARKRMKRIRLAIESKRKELKEASLRYGKAVDSEAKRLTAKAEPIEHHLLSEERIHEAEQDRIREEKQAAKAAVLNERVAALQPYGSIDVAAVTVMDDFEFKAHLKKRVEEFEERREAAAEEESRLQAEYEARMANLESERQQLALQKAELATQLEAANGIRRAEQQRLDSEERERHAIAERNRQEALKPVIEQVDGFAKAVSATADSHLETLGRPWWAEIACDALRLCLDDISKDVEDRFYQ